MLAPPVLSWWPPKCPAASHTALPEPLKTEAFAVGRKTLSLCLVALGGGRFRRSQRSALRSTGAACVVVSGLPGSGKSTLCRLLCAAFEASAWVNQDQFSGSVRTKDLFLRAVESSLEDALQQSTALVCIDKVNLQKVHRREILDRAEEVGWKEKGGLLLLCELSSDMMHCKSRIEGRGVAHRSLYPRQDLQVILQRHSRQSQPLDEEELEAFHKRVTIDAKTEAVDKAFQVITTLRLLGWAPRLRPLGIAQPEAQEWVKFPKVDQRPTFYWNRRTEQSRWSLPSGLEAAWQGAPDEHRPF
ncbi:unnamed protein product [Durusdinium trenchii]|uniref:WW domain-containing protein n=1 Tax=Durusdinium trenchii TaxID=1381693 RepID=A0ABP0QSY6_9DINO